VTWSERPAMVIGPREQVLGAPASGGVLVFDGLCGFCTRAGQRIAAAMVGVAVIPARDAASVTERVQPA
jgi:hypothetical protein